MSRVHTATYLVVCLAAAAVVTAPDSHADDPLQSIKDFVNSERVGANCPPLNYSDSLERDAQYWARNYTLKASDLNVSGYDGVVNYYGATGDPKQAAIDAIQTNERGFRVALDNCDNTEFGVGFYRIDDANGPWTNIPFVHESMDYVTIALGAPTPPFIPPIFAPMTLVTPPPPPPSQTVTTAIAGAPSIPPPAPNPGAGGSSGASGGSNTGPHHAQ